MSKDKQTNTTEVPHHASTSMDDNGGGSETSRAREDDNKSLAAGGQDDDHMQDVPVGIREFMRIEKRLKERKAATT